IAVARANFNIADGCFDFDYVGGKLYFRMLSSYADNLLDKETYEYMLMIACRIVGDYTEKFQTASKKDMTPEEICKYFG
ncbi:MAG: hypothetical protein K2L72_01835, partial [Clostridia bacterium]|nr:hypothetical protein [Clostridia bacterium]